MPKTRSQASLNALRNNIKELTRGNASGNVQSIIEQGRRESKQMIMMENAAQYNRKSNLH